MKFHRLSSLLAFSWALTLSLPAETLPADHPTADVLRTYIKAIVNQDWKTSSEMLVPTSLERRKAQIVEAIKRAPTIPAEATALSMLGIKDLRDLEKMSPQEAYIADRRAVHDQMKVSPEVLKKKQESLKIKILGLVPEEGGKIVHGVVRTSQETGDSMIDELLLISLVQDKDHPKKWLVAPDMQNPITTPLAKTDEKTGERVAGP